MSIQSSIVFTGDIGFDKYMDHRWEDKELIAPSVLSFLSSGDHLAINVEGPLYKHNNDSAASGAASLKHYMEPEAASFFKSIGADIWNICNNHICDAGPEGIRSTIDLAAQNEALTLGAGMNIYEARKPIILSEAGGIGLISVGYQRACRKADTDIPGCFSWSDMEGIRQVIADIKSSNRWCVVVAHGGEEFTALPAPYTRQRYIDYLDMGADIVVAHHPHVPMNYELIGDKAIFYSLGNFIFDTDYQRSQFNTEFGIVLKINFSKDSFDYEAMGIRINRETERIEECSLPRIFTDVNDEEYWKLIPLAAKMFIENTKRQLRFLRPGEFENATDEQWMENFYEPLRSGRVPGEVLDMQIMYPLSQQADSELWKSSTLDGVKEFILEQLES